MLILRLARALRLAGALRWRCVACGDASLALGGLDELSGLFGHKLPLP